MSIKDVTLYLYKHGSKRKKRVQKASMLTVNMLSFFEVLKKYVFSLFYLFRKKLGLASAPLTQYCSVVCTLN